jgi:hypothetical protein
VFAALHGSGFGSERTISLKIPGVVIPCRVFTQPGLTSTAHPAACLQLAEGDIRARNSRLGTSGGQPAATLGVRVKVNGAFELEHRGKCGACAASPINSRGRLRAASYGRSDGRGYSTTSLVISPPRYRPVGR